MDLATVIKDEKIESTQHDNNIETSSSDAQEQSELLLNKPEFTLEEILINLSLISKIDNGNKLVINDKYINIDNSYFNFVTRWLFGSSRMNTMEFIREMLNQSFLHGIKLIQEDSESSNQLLLRLNSELKNSINGLNNLKQTYYTDKAIQAKIDVMIENIRDQLELKLKNFRVQKQSPQQIENTRENNVFGEKYNPSNFLDISIKQKDNKVDKKRRKKKKGVPKVDSLLKSEINNQTV
jgi:hypothetical protein